MAVGKRICKVCGTEYEACHTEWKPGDGNRWQDVACSPEHAAQYFAEIFAARSASDPAAAIRDKQDEPAEQITELTPDANGDEPTDVPVVTKKSTKKSQKGE